MLKRISQLKGNISKLEEIKTQLINDLHDIKQGNNSDLNIQQINYMYWGFINNMVLKVQLQKYRNGCQCHDVFACSLLVVVQSTCTTDQ